MATETVKLDGGVFTGVPVKVELNGGTYPASLRYGGEHFALVSRAEKHGDRIIEPAKYKLTS